MDYKHTSVLIIGAGPVGLTLAIQLARFGIECRIIDKLAKPIGTSNALGVHARTLEIFSEMGVLEPAFEYGHQISAMNLYMNQHRVAHVSFKDIHSLYPFILGLPQNQTEWILTKRLESLGIQIERNKSLNALEFESQKVYARCQDNKKQTELISTDWLIAADGAHSFVRHCLNLPFQGIQLPEHFLLADLSLESNLSSFEGGIFLNKKGVMALLPLKNFTRVIFNITQDFRISKITPPKLEEIRLLVQERGIPGIKLSQLIWSNCFGIQQRMLESYCHKQRVFFVGDAAHIHSPVGGQGMNTGIQDSYNLAWKLAYTIKYAAKPVLLRSYELERKPVAEKVLSATGFSTKLIGLKNPILQSIRNSLLKIFSSSRKFQENIKNKISEKAIHYRDSILSQQVDASKRGPFSGQIMPILPFVFNQQFSALFFSGSTLRENQRQEIDRMLEFLQTTYPDKIEPIFIQSDLSLSDQDVPKIRHFLDKEGELLKMFNANSACLFLVRPDKYIGFRNRPLNLDALKKYLEMIF